MSVTGLEVESILPKQKTGGLFWKIAVGVFVGNAMTAFVGGLVYLALTR